MKENKPLLHAQNTPGDAKFQEESIRHQIAQQDAIIENAQRIIDKSSSDQALAKKAKDFFLQQLKSSFQTSGEDDVSIAILRALSAFSDENGMEISEIHKKVPDVSRGTVFRIVKKLLEEKSIQQVNSDSKKNRRFSLVS